MSVDRRLRALEAAAEAEQVEALMEEAQQERRERGESECTTEQLETLRAFCIEQARNSPRWQRWEAILRLPTFEEMAAAYAIEFPEITCGLSLEEVARVLEELMTGNGMPTPAVAVESVSRIEAHREEQELSDADVTELIELLRQGYDAARRMMGGPAPDVPPCEPPAGLSSRETLTWLMEWDRTSAGRVGVVAAAAEYQTGEEWTL